MSTNGFPTKYTQLWSHTPLGDLVDDESVLPDGLSVDSSLADVVRFVLETGRDNQNTGAVSFFGAEPQPQATGVPVDINSVYDVLVDYGLIKE